MTRSVGYRRQGLKNLECITTKRIHWGKKLLAHNVREVVQAMLAGDIDLEELDFHSAAVLENGGMVRDAFN